MPIAESDHLRIYVLNVGQADTAVIVTPQGNAIVIDAYRPSKLVELLGQIGLQPGAEPRERIAHLVITHPHRDHYDGASRLLSNYDVELVTLAPFWYCEGTPGYGTIVNMIHDGNVPVRFVSGYERIYPDRGSYPWYSEAFVELLGPSNTMMAELDRAGELNPNHVSVMARLTWGSFKMVLAADAQMENWAHFDREGMLDEQCSVLKAAHHGSCRGTQWERLERLAPEYVIVSSDPTLGHHLPDLIGTSIFLKYAEDQVVALTASTGTIEVVVDAGGSYAVSYYEESRTENVPLGHENRLSSGSNPTDWGELLKNRVP